MDPVGRTRKAMMEAVVYRRMRGVGGGGGEGVEKGSVNFKTDLV